MAGVKLVSVDAVYETKEDGVYDCDITMVDESGVPEKVVFTSRVDDPYGLGPAVRAEINAQITDGVRVAPRPQEKLQ